MSPRINAYRFGEMVVDGIPYRHDIIVFPDFVRDSWWRTEGHEINPEDLAEVFVRPDISTIVIGQGDPGLTKLMPAAAKAVEAKGWKVIVEPTTRAWKTYNEMSSTGTVVGAFHLTC